MADHAGALSRALGYLGIFLHVEGIDDTTVPHRARAACRTVLDRNRVGTVQLVERRRRDVVARSEMEHLPVDEEQRAVESIAQPHGAPQDGIEHRLYVRRRLADDPQDFARRRLLFEGCGEASVLFLQLLEEA